MFFPRMQFTIESPRTPEEIRMRLASVTDVWESGQFFHGRLANRDFTGKVRETDFKILPILGKVGFSNMTFAVKDSFLPVIVGRIRRTGERTAIDIKMRLPWPVYVFLLVWFGFASCAFIAGLLAAFTADAGIGLAAGPGGMILAGQLLVRIGFYLPAKMARRKLETLFQM